MDNNRLDLYKSVVKILRISTLGNDDDSLGSGVVFSRTGLVLTNNHVVEDANFGTAFGQITVAVLESADRPANQSFRAEVIIRNELYDLAVLKIDGLASANYIDLVNAPQVDASILEERIRILGYPPLGGATITVTRGVASGFDEDGRIKTDAEINPGNSGGAAMTDTNSFVGIPSFIVSNVDGKLGFIVTVNRIREWFGSILKAGLPTSIDRMETAFSEGNLIFSGDDVDSSNQYPRILGKFAAAELLLANKEFERVMPQIEFILSKRPRSALAYHYAGVALLGLGKYVEAATRFRTALMYDPDHTPALGNLGVTLIHLDRKDEALQIFEKVIDTSDDPAQLWTSYTNIGELYRIRGRNDLAGAYLEKAASLSRAASERLQKHKPVKGKDVTSWLLDAIVKTEIEMEEG